MQQEASDLIQFSVRVVLVVFKGCLDDKGSSHGKRITPIAIKNLNLKSMQGSKEWRKARVACALQYSMIIAFAFLARSSIMMVGEELCPDT